MAVNGIEIEVGQRWRDRAGDIRRISKSSNPSYPWNTGSGATVTDDGKQVIGAECNIGDIIELVEHADGFKPWAGGEQPEETRGKLVVFRMAERHEARGHADLLRWDHIGFDSDIVAYKVVAEATRLSPEPLHVELIEPEVSAPALLNAAAGHMAARASTYDKPEGERSMAQTVAVFKAHHGIELTEAQGWHFMQILKDVRLFTRESYHADSAEDCIAYAALKAEALAREGSAK